MQITLSRTRTAWVADFSQADNAQTVYNLFGTYVLPTPYTPQADAERVRQGIAQSNPGHVILVKE